MRTAAVWFLCWCGVCGWVLCGAEGVLDARVEWLDAALAHSSPEARDLLRVVRIPHNVPSNVTAVDVLRALPAVEERSVDALVEALGDLDLIPADLCLLEP